MLSRLSAALAVVLVPALAVAQPTSPQEKGGGRGRSGVMALGSSEIPGVICSGKTLDIGLNQGGGFGVGSVSGVGTGFRFPNSLGDDAESLAIWFWGEGWKLSYKERMRDGSVVDKTAYWQPSIGYPPPASSNFEPVSAKLLRDDEQACVYKVMVRTKDRKIYLTFDFDFQKAFPSVVLTTTVASASWSHLFDVIYARAVDYDIHTNTNNFWSSNDTAAFACGNNGTTPSVTLSVAGMVDPAASSPSHVCRHGKALGTCDYRECADTAPRVFYVDEDTFDYLGGGYDVDYDERGPGDSVIKNRVPYAFDGFASVYYLLGELNAGQKKSVATVYSAAYSKTDACLP